MQFRRFLAVAVVVVVALITGCEPEKPKTNAAPVGEQGKEKRKMPMPPPIEKVN